MDTRPFFGESSRWEHYRDRMVAHIEADELIQKVGWDRETHRGCFIGCTMNGYDRAAWSDELNIPLHIAYLCDFFHESLPPERIREFAMRFFDGVNLDGDASLWWPKFGYRLMTDADYGMVGYTEAGSEAHHAIEQVARLFRSQVEGTPVTQSEWAAANDAAWAAASDAAWPARAAARTAANASAWAAASDAVSDAARAASWAASWAARTARAGRADRAARAARDTRAAASDAARAADECPQGRRARRRHLIWQADSFLEIIGEKIGDHLSGPSRRNTV